MSGDEHRTPNIEHRTPNGGGVRHSVFSPLVLAALASVVTLGVGLFVVSRYEWNFSALLLVGEYQFAKEKPAEVATTNFYLPEYFHEGVVVHEDNHGYDGGAYYIIARDPLQFDKDFAPGFKFNNQFRYQRFLFPLLVWVFSGGRASGMPFVMFAINVVAVGVTVWAGARIARIEGMRPVWILPAAFSGGLLFAAVYSMTFPLCLALAALAVLADRTRGPLAAMPLWAAALVAKEQALVVVGAFGLAYLVRREWRGFLWTAVSGVPFGVYQIIAKIIHPNPALGASKFFLAAPFSGMVRMLGGIAWDAPAGQLAMSITPVMIMVFVIASGVYAAAALRRRCDGVPMAILACAALAVFSYEEWWVTLVNAARVNVPIFFLTGVLFARKKDIIGALLVILSMAVWLAMLARIVIRAAGPYHLVS